MTSLEVIPFRMKPIRKELGDFAHLLQQNNDLDERKTILPFFASHKALSAFLGCFSLQIIRPDRMKHEFGISGDFTCDLFVGDSERRSYCFVEFEDAGPNSLLKRTGGKGTPEWSARFEHGFSQLVVWFCRLDDEAKLKKWANVFGGGHVHYSGMLIAGRDAFITGNEDRLRWRSERVLINTKAVLCMTYDQLLRDAVERLDLMEGK